MLDRKGESGWEWGCVGSIDAVPAGARGRDVAHIRI